MPITLNLFLQFLCYTFALQTQTPSIYFNQAFTLGQYDQITITDSASIEHEKLTLSLGNILDSRCPKNVFCIQAGNAELNLTLNTLNGDKTSFKLAIGGNTNKSPELAQAKHITLAGTTYSVKVLNVSPYPTATGEQSPKNVRLIVARL